LLFGLSKISKTASVPTARRMREFTAKKRTKLKSKARAEFVSGADVSA